VAVVVLVENLGADPADADVRFALATLRDIAGRERWATSRATD